MMAKLILFSILIAAWSVTYTGQSLSALLDETASAIQFYEMNENRPTKDIIYSEHKHEDKFDSLRPKVARLVAEPPANWKSKPISAARIHNKETPKNRRMTHFIQKGIMEAASMGSFTNTRLLMQQIIDGCNAKQFSFARKILGQLIHHNKMKKTPTKWGRRTRNPARKRPAETLAELKKTLGRETFRKLMGFDNPVTLSIAFDTTGSMQDEINAFKKIAKEIVNVKRNFSVEYILSPFNDPTAGKYSADRDGPAKHWTRKEDFLHALDKLTADGGGDCPEMVVSGINRVFTNGFLPYSPIFVFTDAGAKDSNDLSDLELIKRSYKSPVTFVLSESDCLSKKDYQFYKCFAEDCGDQLLSISPSSMKLRNLIETEFVGTCNLPATKSKRKRRSGNIDSYNIQVDDTIDNLSINVVSDAKNADINLYDSGGSLILEGKTTSSEKDILYSIKAPAHGQWKLQIPRQSTEPYITVKGSSHENINFDFDFQIEVKVGIRRKKVISQSAIEGHQTTSLITINGHGKTIPSSLELQIVTKDDLSVLKRCTLRQKAKQAERFTAQFKVPNGHFRIILKGKTKDHIPFQRLWAQTIKPQKALIHIFAAPKGRTVSSASSHVNSMIFAAHTFANTERFSVDVHPKDAVAQGSGDLTIVPGRASLFIIKLKATKEAKKGQLLHCIVSVTGKKSGIKASKVVPLHIQ